MNRLKSIFVSMFITLVSIFTIISGVKLFQNGFSLTWLGVVFAAGTVMLFFSFLMLTRSKPRTSANLPGLLLLIVFGVLMTVAGTWQAKEFSVQPLFFSVFSLAGWLVYVYWYSRFGRGANPKLRSGNLLPNFSLENPQGKIVQSTEFRGAPTIFLFYRGNWCPLCMAQIKEIAARYREIAKGGTRIALISPQPHKFTQKLAAKYAVPFDFLVDKDNKAAKQLDIFAKNGVPFGMEVLGFDSDTVLPTVIITDADGKIVFADLTDNYRVRPEPETFINVLANLEKIT